MKRAEQIQKERGETPSEADLFNNVLWAGIYPRTICRCTFRQVLLGLHSCVHTGFLCKHQCVCIDLLEMCAAGSILLSLTRRAASIQRSGLIGGEEMTEFLHLWAGCVFSPQTVCVCQGPQLHVALRSGPKANPAGICALISTGAAFTSAR